MNDKFNSFLISRRFPPEFSGLKYESILNPQTEELIESLISAVNDENVSRMMVLYPLAGNPLDMDYTQKVFYLAFKHILMYGVSQFNRILVDIITISAMAAHAEEDFNWSAKYKQSFSNTVLFIPDFIVSNDIRFPIEITTRIQNGLFDLMIENNNTIVLLSEFPKIEKNFNVWSPSMMSKIRNYSNTFVLTPTRR